MSRNPLVNMAADVFTAIAALKLKRAQFVSTSEGVVIQQPGKPDLLLTYAAAADFAHEIEEAQHA